MSGLTSMQERALEALAGLEPKWVLFGGGALIGFVLGHRMTADLDISFRDRAALGDATRLVDERLRARGLDVEELQTSPSFRRVRVKAGGESVVIDLIAEILTPVEAPVERRPGVWVDTPHELLVQKLCALLSRSEVRDLVDVAALVEAGGDLRRGIGDAPSHDAGFSPATLAWVLQSFPLDRASSLGFDRGQLTFARDELVKTLLSP